MAEAFARAMASRVAIRSPRSWLYRTAFRLAAAELRLGRRALPLVDNAVSGPEEIVEVVQALRLLSPGQRAAAFLRYEVQLPTKEVARLMGTTEAVVRVHLFRASRRLRAALGSEEVPDA